MREIREPRPLNCGGENDRCISPTQKSWEHSEGGMGRDSPTRGGIFGNYNNIVDNSSTWTDYFLELILFANTSIQQIAVQQSMT